MTHCTDGVRFLSHLLFEMQKRKNCCGRNRQFWPGKLVLCGTDGRLLLSDFQAVVTLTSTPLCIREPSNFKVAWHKNWDKYQKSGRIKLRYCALFLRVSGHLPAPIVNGGGDRLRKVQFSELQKPRDLDLAIGSGHMAYRRASLINLHTKFHWNCKKTFCGWTDVRTYVWKYLLTEFQTPCNVIRSTRRSRPNKTKSQMQIPVERLFVTQFYHILAHW